MFGNAHKLRWCALLLGIVFLAAQFHFCSDINSSQPGSSHPCQLCSTAGSAITPSTVSLSVIPLVRRLEIGVAFIVESADSFRATSPRAPPVL
jgi:hypothetical protein